MAEGPLCPSISSRAGVTAAAHRIVDDVPMSDPALDLDTAFMLRGAFISTVSNLEGIVEIALCKFYGKQAQDEQFRARLLGRLTFAGKVDILSQFLDELEAQELHKGLVAEIRELQQERNIVAHTSISPRFSGLEEIARFATNMKTEDLSAATIQINLVGLEAHGVKRHRFFRRDEDLVLMRSWLDRARAAIAELAGTIERVTGPSR